MNSAKANKALADSLKALKVGESIVSGNSLKSLGAIRRNISRETNAAFNVQPVDSGFRLVRVW